MSDTEQTSTPDGNADPSGDEQGQSSEQQEQTFTQADVDRIVKERVQRERAKFADYDDLKTKAGEKATAEERLADLEKRYADAEARALRANIASEYGVSAEDRDLFLTGTDEETLTAQAKRLADRESERKKRSNHVPDEGNNPQANGGGDEREFARQLFGRAIED